MKITCPASTELFRTSFQMSVASSERNEHQFEGEIRKLGCFETEGRLGTVIRHDGIVCRGDFDVTITRAQLK